MIYLRRTPRNAGWFLLWCVISGGWLFTWTTFEIVPSDTSMLRGPLTAVIPYSGLFSRGEIFRNARCGDISRVKFSRMVNKEFINNHTPIYFQGENIRE